MNLKASFLSLVLILLGIAGGRLMAAETNRDAEFVRYYQALEPKRAWNQLNALTSRLNILVENPKAGKQLLIRDPRSASHQLHFRQLDALEFSACLNPDSTGALAITLWRNELGHYFIRVAGGCVAYRDNLFGPFIYRDGSFVWPEKYAKGNNAGNPPQ